MLTSPQSDFSKWYLDLVQAADLCDYAPVKGCIIFKPYGYRIWELLRDELDQRIKQLGVENAYFPMLIPESFIKREAEHVEGFAPELLTATRVGENELDEPYVLRPTSETIIYDSYAKWIHSYRDLPVKMNQWANIIRWEKRPRPFLRTSEFLWQEGHTVHATREEADQMVMDALEMYDQFEQEVLALSGIKGRKSDAEKFPGAEYTTTIEVLAKDGKSIQSGTSHQLGQGFAKSFNIQFTNKEEQLTYPWITSWGVTTRLIGTVIMIHGDEKGLRLPPRIAPYQVVIVPITLGKEQPALMDKVYEIQNELQRLGVRVKIDNRDDKSPGFKFNEWELKGVPLRLELGPKDLANESVMAFRRDLNQKFAINFSEIKQIPQILAEIQDELLNQANEFLQSHIIDVFDWEKFCEVIEDQRGFARVNWCGEGECEKKIKEKTKATSRCIPFAEMQKEVKGGCVHCGKPAKHITLFAKAY